MVDGSWIDRAEYPFKSQFMELGKKRLHYVDEGSGPVVLFVHGCPTWSFMYRHLIKGLRNQFRCIAIDNLGYGLSDKPINATYRPEKMAEYLGDFIDRLGLRKVTLVAHGMGGPIALGYAVQNPDNVAHLCLMNTFMWPLQYSERVKKIDRLVNGPFGRFMYLTWNLPVRRMKQMVLDKKYFTKDVYEHYVNALDEPALRVAAYGYARALLGASDYYQSIWDRRDAINRIPTMLIWGMKDQIFGPDALEKMVIAFPDAEIKRLPLTGHFVPEEKGPGLAPFVEMFLQDTSYVSSATVI